MAVTFEREPDNPADPFAVAIFVPALDQPSGRAQIGYVPADCAEEFAESLDAGDPLSARIKDIDDVSANNSGDVIWGVILLVKTGPPEERADVEAEPRQESIPIPVRYGDSSWKFVVWIIKISVAIGIIFYLLYRAGRR
jgi:hypothetical protein